MLTLKGIAWDHRRCWGPLEASIQPWKASTGQDVIWDRRSLYSFGEGDLSDFVSDYDLLIYDHPFVGDIAEKRLLHDLSAFLTAEDLQTFAKDSVGQSWASYSYGSGLWGLPIDAAGQTAAARPDLLSQAGEVLPETLDDVIALAERLRPRGLFVGWPANPTDLMGTFLSIAASSGADPGRGQDGRFLDPELSREGIGMLRRLFSVVHPASRGWNPIRCLDHMAATDEVAYVPWLFNYVNYSTTGPIRFAAPPRVAQAPARTVLGGAGIGISAQSRNPEAAFAYAMHLCSPGFQSGPYVEHGGQPGSRSAWTSETANHLSNGFFAATLPALDAAWLRTRPPGYIAFFHEATLRIADVVATGTGEAAFADWLNEAYGRIVPDGTEAMA
ncbi:MAG: extracellular solute-binding protein [Rubellimicrobium sp.]|nr:extracellular solute-binding protein [Rubellimicrobium sp.]